MSNPTPPPMSAARLDVPQWTVTAAFADQTWTWTHAGPVNIDERIADGVLQLATANGSPWDVHLNDSAGTARRLSDAQSRQVVRAAVEGS